MIWLAVLLLSGIFGWYGAGWYAPAMIGVLVGLVIAVDGIAANEFTSATFSRLAIVIASSFFVWGASRALRRYLTTAG
ncbi:hypothetical protein [Hyphomicrobium sp.]|uniref:hypothetical protein n=1 Tax=Hyphomicrobium sp. TaxID=82 RepID=UPI000F9A03DA|nr:hypothetical protein [Hyphomicrobium sp.]MBN9248865.1 hypothetical protein [Hyphomicrobium sp.]RUP09222.1 MAG: hypothetical protein EKK38_11400 [Hyphomicrobium sp.]